MLKSLYLAASAAALLLFAAHGFMGIDLFSSRKASMSMYEPTSSTSGGGGRSFIYWNTGYQGGK